VKEYIFGEIIFVGEGSQINPRHTASAIVRRIDERYLLPDDIKVAEPMADEIMIKHGYDGYLCPTTYKGRIILVNKEGEVRSIIPIGVSAS
jgi:hypothetical protein